MSVVVKDMIMPRVCYECEFAVRMDNNHTYCRRYPMESPVEDGSMRPEFCPLEEPD